MAAPQLLANADVQIQLVRILGVTMTAWNVGYSQERSRAQRRRPSWAAKTCQVSMPRTLELAWQWCY